MNEPNNDWQELQAQWQSYQPDIKKITRKINWVTWRMIAVLAIDVLVVVSYAYFLFYEIMPQKNPWIIDIWFYLIGAATVYGVYLDFKLRIPIFRLKSESTKDVLGLYLSRTKVGIQLGLICKIFLYGLLIAFLIWVAAIQYMIPDEPKYTEWKFIVFGSAWICLFIPVSYWYQGKKQKEYDQLKALWQDYLEE